MGLELERFRGRRSDRAEVLLACAGLASVIGAVEWVIEFERLAELREPADAWGATALVTGAIALPAVIFGAYRRRAAFAFALLKLRGILAIAILAAGLFSLPLLALIPVASDPARLIDLLWRLLPAEALTVLAFFLAPKPAKAPRPRAAATEPSLLLLRLAPPFLILALACCFGLNTLTRELRLDLRANRYGLLVATALPALLWLAFSIAAAALARRPFGPGLALARACFAAPALLAAGFGLPLTLLLLLVGKRNIQLEAATLTAALAFAFAGELLFLWGGLKLWRARAREAPADDSRAPLPTGAGRCAYCHEDLAGKGRPCPQCRTLLHAACWLELDRCPSIGCTVSPRLELGEDRPEDSPRLASP